MHDCSKCFWTFHEGNQWEQATVMSETKRKELCLQLQLQDYGNRTNRKCGGIVGLGQPAATTCQSKLAEGGGKCWFSSEFYLLNGRKSGKGIMK